MGSASARCHRSPAACAALTEVKSGWRSVRFGSFGINFNILATVPEAAVRVAVAAENAGMEKRVVRRAPCVAGSRGGRPHETSCATAEAKATESGTPPEVSLSCAT